MKADRFLVAILAGIVLLIVVSLTLFFARQKNVDYRSDDTPENVAYNFILALQRKNYEKAYGYLADLPNKPGYAAFRQAALSNQENYRDAGVSFGTTTLNGDEASVSLVIQQSYGPFEPQRSQDDYADLVRQNGTWKIARMAYPFWQWEWYQPPLKP